MQVTFDPRDFKADA